MGGHGYFSSEYWRWWGRLMFQEPKHTLMVTSPILIASAGGGFLACWTIWKSVAYDPEVRIRPHKKAWHITDRRIANALKYRHGAFAWYYKLFQPKRYRFEMERLETAFEELHIPKE